MRVLRAYSGEAPACACCGESRLPFLTLDHISNGGRAHRRRCKGWQGVFRELVRSGFPPGYQVLCFNCNLARGAYGACPHKATIDESPRPIKPRKPVISGAEPDSRKRCTCCKQDLPLAAFYADKGTRSGLQSRCRTCTRDASLARLRAARQEALQHYGDRDLRCACCGEREEKFLVLDHINGGGPRRPGEWHGGNVFYAWLARRGFPPGLRLLCHNCNCAMGRDRTCPHGAAAKAARGSTQRG